MVMLPWVPEVFFSLSLSIRFPIGRQILRQTIIDILFFWQSCPVDCFLDNPVYVSWLTLSQEGEIRSPSYPTVRVIIALYISSQFFAIPQTRRFKTFGLVFTFALAFSLPSTMLAFLRNAQSSESRGGMGVIEGGGFF